MGEPKLVEIVNQSGFPLQIAVVSQIARTTRQHFWQVLYTEHAWRNEFEDADGYIDVVLETTGQNLVLVIECKRVRETSWIFLKPTGEPEVRWDAKFWLSRHAEGRWTYFDWVDGALKSASPQAEYCVVRGEDPKAKPMLERVSAEVVAATEALAWEEKGLPDKYRHPIRLYASVIVTTAELQVCTLDPNDVSLRDGTLHDADFRVVPFVRFRKQLSTRSGAMKPVGHDVYKALAHAKERMVFIVNAESLLEFLKAFNVDEATIHRAVGT